MSDLQFFDDFSYLYFNGTVVGRIKPAEVFVEPFIRICSGYEERRTLNLFYPFSQNLLHLISVKIQVPHVSYAEAFYTGTCTEKLGLSGQCACFLELLGSDLVEALIIPTDIYRGFFSFPLGLDGILKQVRDASSRIPSHSRNTIIFEYPSKINHRCGDMWTRISALL
jgi:hypothetical protein